MQIPISKIDPPKFLLREVDTQSLKYAEIRHSLRTTFQHQSILVRPIGDRYELVEGNHRLTIAKELQWTNIEAIVREMTDEQVLAIQLTNTLRVETSDAEIMRHLQRLQKLRPDMTISDMQRITSKNRTWITRRLGLDHLISEARLELEEGRLTMSNAFELATIRSRPRQIELLPAAVSLTAKQFSQLAAKHRREMILAAKARSANNRIQGKRLTFPRTRQAVTNELNSGIEGAAVICKETPADKLDAFHLGVKWCWQLL